MPKCKNCGARISKLDNDICPVCGEKNPLEGVSSETVEITSIGGLSIDDKNMKNYHPKTKIKLLVCFVLLGWSGLGFFYLNYKKIGMSWLIISLMFIGGIGSLIAFATPLGPIGGYLTCLGVLYLLNIILGIFLFFKRDFKDGNGEFVK